MNLYKISQEVNDNYDTYDSAIVCAESEEDARSIHPDGAGDAAIEGFTRSWNWVEDKKDVKVELIGTPHIFFQVRGVILSSFNAG